MIIEQQFIAGKRYNKDEAVPEGRLVMAINDPSAVPAELNFMLV
jgi:hypothetical protein